MDRTRLSDELATGLLIVTCLMDKERNPGMPMSQHTPAQLCLSFGTGTFSIEVIKFCPKQEWRKVLN